MISINIRRGVSCKFKEMAWNIFFVSKERGISFEHHFPALSFDETTWSVEVNKGKEVIGGLVVKERTVTSNNETIIIGCIGLVCVEPCFRGRGIANQMFDTAIEESLKRGYSALTLWTSQHHIYKNKGFVLYDNTIHGSIRFTSTKEPSLLNITSTTFPSNLGVPPFARLGKIFCSKNIEVKALWDDEGGIIVDWQGSDVDVYNLIHCIFSESFRINTRVNCSLSKLFELNHCFVELVPTNLQMWLPLKDNIDIRKIDAVMNFSVLDRI